MTIEKIKNNLEINQNKVLQFKINGSRNQVQEFRGKIIGLYRAVFLIKPEDNDIIQSFAYTDVLIGNVEIKGYKELHIQ